MNKLPAVLLFSLCALSSCKKEEPNPAPNPATTVRQLYAYLGKLHKFDGISADTLVGIAQESIADDSIASVTLNEAAIPPDSNNPSSRCIRRFSSAELDVDAPVRWQFLLRSQNTRLDYTCDVLMPGLQITAPDTISLSAGLDVPFATNGEHTAYAMEIAGIPYSGEGYHGYFSLRAENLKAARTNDTIKVYFSAYNTVNPVSGAYQLNFQKYYEVEKTFYCRP